MPGDRIAQLVVQRVAHAVFREVADALPDTVRGAGGYGSTGGHATLGERVDAHGVGTED